jgi:hypothetical protein
MFYTRFYVALIIMKTRSFIDETIQSLESSAVEIKRIWNLFKNGDINKEQFEENYHQVLSGWLSELEHEEYTPNNGCKYKVTNPDCKFFNDADV